MKKVLYLLLAVVTIGGFYSCSDDNEDEQKSIAQTMGIVGQFTGKDSVNVGGQLPYWTDNQTTYTITENSDGTINVTVPEVTISGTVIGDLTIGSYTVSNLKYDAKQMSFVRAYGEDGITFHFTAKQNGTTTMDADYTFNAAICNILVTMSNGKVYITNAYQMGKMPMPVREVFFQGKE